MLLQIGQFRLDTEAFELHDGDAPVALEPQVLALITFLVENNDRIVGKDEIFDHVWDGRIVSDSALNSRINAARRALGDNGKDQTVIRTFPRRGFRFIGAVENETAPNETGAEDTTRRRLSVVVLPFVNLSTDPEQQYFSDGISEEITIRLSRLKELSVVSRNTAFALRNQALDAQTVSQQLGVRYILEGSVRKAQDRVRVSVELVEGETASTLFAHTYDGELKDVFKVQDEIALAVAAAVEPTLTRRERAKAMAMPQIDLDAWDYYLRGMSNLIDRGEYAQPAMMALAREDFKKSIKLDPGFARAHAGFGFANFFLFMTDPRQEVIDEGLEAARNAISLNPEDGFGYVVLMGLQLRNRKSDEAIQAGKRALQLNPDDMWANGIYGVTLACTGHAEEAIPVLKKATGVWGNAPQAGPGLAQLANAYIFLGQYEEAVQWAHRSLSIPSTQYWGNLALTVAHALLGNHDDAKLAARGLLYRRPNLTISWMVEHSQYTHVPHRDILVQGLRLAGIPEK